MNEENGEMYDQVYRINERKQDIVEERERERNYNDKTIYHIIVKLIQNEFKLPYSTKREINNKKN